ncbi:MAG: phosphoenolpyruvate--protein phosphotransferase [Chthoniobacteraceae bacterium]
MIELTAENIRLGATAKTKEEAIRQAGGVLVEIGAITPVYVESMLGREEQANTFLGNGIAIPHGMQKDRAAIQRTAVSVVQFPGGVEWNPGQTVHLAFGIAALSDEHITVLSALTDVLDDFATAQRLATTRNPDEIIACLMRRTPSSATVETGIEGDYVEATIIGEAGLHARPATFFAQLASGFGSEIKVQVNGKTANAKSMPALLKLGAAKGATLRIFANGADATAALQALAKAVAEGLGDLEEAHELAAPSAGQAWAPVSNGRAVTGVSASPGVAIGQLFQFQATRIVVKDTPKSIEDEDQAFKNAIAVATTQIEDIYQSVSARAGKAQADIFHAHIALLNDEDMQAEVLSQIDAGHSAAWAWQQSIERRVEELKSIDNPRLAERATDFHDVGQRVLRLLAGTENATLQLPEHPVILIADDLQPSDTARLDPRRILGLCTAAGGPTSHTAIIARSLDIPAVVGAGAAVLELANGDEAILDGLAGVLYVEPTEEDLSSAREYQRDQQSQRNAEYETRYQPAMLTDGARVEVSANIGKASEAAAAVEAGAEGVGLLRTEFLFLDRDSAPTEDEQFAAYSEMTRALNGLPLIIRTLDIGGDKVLPYLALPHEENPFLGVRGIRLCLRQPELFLPQLRAIYRASVTGPIRIMFPMISTLEDLRAAKELAEEVRKQLDVPPVEIGIMVEVPSTVLMAAELAKEVDFFSIGTNDLTQYALAMDRLHASLAKNVDGLHPAVLRLIDMTVRAAKAEGKWTGVCGGIAGDPLGAAILSGLGVAELSMSLPSIAAVKASLRRLSLAQAQTLARKALACSTAPEVHQLPLA